MKIYYLLIITSWLARWVPERLGYWLCSFVGGIVYFVRPSIRRAIRDNMQHVLPRSSERQRRTISRRVIRNNFKNYDQELAGREHINRITFLLYGQKEATVYIDGIFFK